MQLRNHITTRHHPRQPTQHPLAHPHHRTPCSCTPSSEVTHPPAFSLPRIQRATIALSGDRALDASRLRAVITMTQTAASARENAAAAAANTTEAATAGAATATQLARRASLPGIRGSGRPPLAPGASNRVGCGASASSAAAAPHCLAGSQTVPLSAGQQHAAVCLPGRASPGASPGQQLLATRPRPRYPCCCWSRRRLHPQSRPPIATSLTLQRPPSSSSHCCRCYLRRCRRVRTPPLGQPLLRPSPRQRPRAPQVSAPPSPPSRSCNSSGHSCSGGRVVARWTRRSRRPSQSGASSLGCRRQYRRCRARRLRAHAGPPGPSFAPDAESCSARRPRCRLAASLLPPALGGGSGGIPGTSRPPFPRPT